MPTKNEDKVVTTAEVLLDEIGKVARQTTVPSELHDLAQAFALVAEHDPKAISKSTRAVWA